MILLSIISILFGMWPYFFNDITEYKVMNSINWVDLYITGLFSIDLVVLLFYLVTIFYIK